MKFKKQKFFDHISALGSKDIFVILILFLYIIKQTKTANLILISGILAYLIAIPIRYFYKKERPKKKPRNNFLEQIEANSFPSMHATRSSIMLIALTKLNNYNLDITLFLTTITLLIFYARIYKKRHDYKDIIGGIILGCITSITTILI